MRLLLSKRAILSKLLGLALATGLGGWIFDLVLELLLLYAVVLISWHYKHLFMLDKWLWRDRKLSPPAGDGSWQQVFDGIYYQQRKSRKKNKELRGLVRRFRDGAGA